MEWETLKSLHKAKMGFHLFMPSEYLNVEATLIIWGEAAWDIMLM